MTPGIVCVDPDEGARAETVAALEPVGLDVVGVPSLADAREQLSTGVECVVTEHDLPDGDAMDVARATREDAPDATVVVFTDAAPAEVDTEGATDLVVEYVSKAGADAREELAWLAESSVALRFGTAYPTPDDEDARLDALSAYAVDDDALREALDRLATLAAEALDATNAAVGLVDRHEQFFLACYGDDWDPIDREATVCTYAILDEEVTAIEDLLDDPRFESNEDIRDLGIRAYASANLTTPDGRVVGTFCVYDDEPRAFSDRERELLRAFAAEASDQLELRRRLREREAASGGAGGD